MRVRVWVWKCEVVTCGHVWLARDVIPPPQCAKCKSRKWHTKPKDILDQAIDRAPEGCIAVHLMTEDGMLIESRPVPPKPDMEALRAICAGQFSQKEPTFDNPLTREQVDSQISRIQQEAAEVAICGKDWWEDGEHYECLMDKGHKETKHGMRGMVRVLS